MNKILIVSMEPREQLRLEEILQQLVQEGAEVFMVKSVEQALVIAKRENPQLIFFDGRFVDKEEEGFWEDLYPERLVWMREIGKQRQGDIALPLVEEQVLEKCGHHLQLPHSVKEILPM